MLLNEIMFVMLPWAIHLLSFPGCDQITEALDHKRLPLDKHDTNK